jgi:hypothetical protein
VHSGFHMSRRPFVHALPSPTTWHFREQSKQAQAMKHASVVGGRGNCTQRLLPSVQLVRNVFGVSMPAQSDRSEREKIGAGRGDQRESLHTARVHLIQTLAPAASPAQHNTMRQQHPHPHSSHGAHTGITERTGLKGWTHHMSDQASLSAPL